VIASQLHTEEICPFGESDQEIVIDLVHDLRQPLSSIEAIAYYLELRLSPEQAEVREYVLKLQVLVEEANRMLTRAVAGKIKVAVATV
jgi:signal transduction histidine kinase